MESNLLTAQEVADLLKIKKNTVYELIRRGDIPSSKVGKQVRVSRKDIELFLEASKEQAASQPPRQGKGESVSIPAPATPPQTEGMVICGQDMCLDLLVGRLASEGRSALRAFMGCYNGLYALYNDQVSIAASHLWDMETDTYNFPYIKSFLPGIPVGVVRIAGRMQGYYVKAGNPKGINSWKDLSRDDISMVNREKGCGVRALLDQKLKALSIAGNSIEGYRNERNNHLAVASAVAKGVADVGCGNQKTAFGMEGVSFIPLQMEWYDLVFKLEDRDKPEFKIILDYILSQAFINDLEVIGGYDLSETGKMFEL